MKLTPEQIEVERVKFEEWFRGPDDGTILKTDEDGNYLFMAAYHSFNTWLACRESNNEIELSDMLPIDRLILSKSLESQGFTVVTK